MSDSPSKNVEIERKFLVSSLSAELLALPTVRIEQGFLNADKERVTRIRVTSEGEAFLTVKGIAHGATRVEIETAIDPAKAKAMLAMVEGDIISKTRRKAIVGGKTWEIDVFDGANEGLIVAEIELDSEDETFEIPAWVGTEVTVDGRYANSSLAMAPFASWAQSGVKTSKP